jgi:hypothetical protein
VDSGPTGPGIGLAIGAPPEGIYGAVSSQSGPGSHVLYQDVALEAGASHTLTLSLYWVNTASFIIPSPETLDENGVGNQQYRIDVMKPSAVVTSVDPADVLVSVFGSQPGDPTSQAPRDVTADLSALAGQTVRLRIAETDNQAFFSAAVDDVRIDSTLMAGPAVSTPLTIVAPDAAPPVARAPVVCSSARRFTIHLRPAYVRLTSATVTVNGKRIPVRMGRRMTAVVDPRGLPRGAYKAIVDSRDAAGHAFRDTRTYRTCRSPD